MNVRTSTLFAIGLAALVASVAGCSADNSAGFSGTNDAGPSGSGGTNTEGGGTRADAGSSGGNGSSGSSGSGSGGSSGSSSGSGGSSGSSSGVSRGTAEAGASADAGSQVPDASSNPDATAGHDAGPDTGAGFDAGGTGNNDAGLCADQSAWLVPMNQARAKLNVGEPALVCDPIAAQVALNYAKQCQGGATPRMLVHNMSRNAQYMALGGTGGVGENIAAGAPTQGPAEAVSLWLGEASSYNYASNTCSGVCGHYTQIVWKATTGVGCAHVSCNTNFFGGGAWDFNVCDFSPPGNANGQRPY